MYNRQEIQKWQEEQRREDKRLWDEIDARIRAPKKEHARTMHWEAIIEMLALSIFTIIMCIITYLLNYFNE